MSDETRDPSDAYLDRAISALRNTPAQAGPSPELIERTLTSVRKIAPAGSHANRLRVFHMVTRVAALLILVAGVVLAVTTLGRQRADVAEKAPSIDKMPPPGVASGIDHRPAVPQGNPSPSHQAVVAKEPVTQPAPVIAGDSQPGIRGTVSFVGAVPTPGVIDMSSVATCRERHPQGGIDNSVLVANARVQNVVVSIEPYGASQLPYAAPVEPIILDQRDCQFHPRILAAIVGQELVVKNSDPFLHNVHSRATQNPKFNIGQPSLDPGKRLDALVKAERVEIRCDIHPWMKAVISIFEHPYFSISKADGSFDISTKNLPDGEYNIVAWHEMLGTKMATVTVQNGRAEAIDFSFQAGLSAAESPKSVAVCSACKR